MNSIEIKQGLSRIELPLTYIASHFTLDVYFLPDSKAIRTNSIQRYIETM